MRDAAPKKKAAQKQIGSAVALSRDWENGATSYSETPSVRSCDDDGDFHPSLQ